MQPSQQEILWVLRAQSGDREAMNKLFIAVQDPLYRFLRSLGAGAHSAEDLLQETMVTIYRKIAWLHEPSLFRPWSYRIAHRLASRRLASELREHDRFDSSAEIDGATSGVESITHLDGEMAELLDLVSAKSRAVLALRFQHGLELAEIADVLELPLGTVKSRLGYGLAMLRKQLGGPKPSLAGPATLP